MTLRDDRPSTAERYGSAMQSSHLEVTERAGDVDLLIAAGWARDGLGCQLYRLRAEFDSINRLELARADSHAARLMAFSRLTSLRGAMDALDKFAQAAALRKKYRGEPSSIRMIAAKCLTFWMAPHCHHCTGRGVTGGFGAPLLLCRHCHGTGKLQVRLAKTEPGHQFGRALLNLMDNKTEFVAQRMSTFLGQRAAAKQIRRDAAKQALAMRLADLRSTAAQED